jgi:hypothetical protein
LFTAIFHLLNWKKSLAKMKDPKLKRCKNSWLVLINRADIINRQPSETHSLLACANRDFLASLLPLEVATFFGQAKKWKLNFFPFQLMGPKQMIQGAFLDYISDFIF